MDSHKAIFRILTYKSMPAAKRFSLIPEAHVVLSCAEEAGLIGLEDVAECEQALKIAWQERNSPNGKIHLRVILEYLRHLIVSATMGQVPNNIRDSDETLNAMPHWLREKTSAPMEPKDKAAHFIKITMSRLATA